MVVSEGRVDVGRLMTEAVSLRREAEVREGWDFSKQEDVQRIVNGPALLRRVNGIQLKLVQSILEEVSLIGRTGQLPDDVPWSEQPAWRLDLWEYTWDALERESTRE